MPSCSHSTLVLYCAALLLKVNMAIDEQMNHNQTISDNNNSLGGVLQIVLNDDDDHPPSSWRTLACAYTCVNKPAWVRKA